MFTVLESRGTTLTVLLTGEIDHHCAGKIRDEIDAAIEHHRPESLILDFGGVSFMDSSGIGLILGRAECCEKMSIQLVIRGLSGRVGMLIRMSGVGKIRCIKLEA